MPDLVTDGVAWFLAWLFAIAALHKYRSPVYYCELLSSWLPGMRAVPVAVFGVATTELLLVLALLVPGSRPAGLLAAAMLLLVYAVVMGMQLAQGRRDVKCGCAGPASDVTISPALLLRNVLCALLALSILVPPVPVAAGISGTVFSLSIAIFLLVSYLASEQMIVNAQHLAGER